MPPQILIDRVVAGQQNGQALVVPPAAAAGLLPGAGDRARITGQQGHVERADVDAQFQRVGGRHAAQTAAEQLRFDLAAFERQIAAAIGPHLIGQFRVPRLELLLLT